jgi:hypothetical protein
MNPDFKKAWNVDLNTNKFTPNYLEWLAWIGQPMIYDGGLCVNRTPEEHQCSLLKKGSLSV